MAGSAKSPSASGETSLRHPRCSIQPPSSSRKRLVRWSAHRLGAGEARTRRNRRSPRAGGGVGEFVDRRAAPRWRARSRLTKMSQSRAPAEAVRQPLGFGAKGVERDRGCHRAHQAERGPEAAERHPGLMHTFGILGRPPRAGIDRADGGAPRGGWRRKPRQAGRRDRDRASRGLGAVGGHVGRRGRSRARPCF